MGRGPVSIGPGLFAVAGPDLTDGRDAAAYLVEDPEGLILIDAGAGPSAGRLVENIRRASGDPDRLVCVVATHAHIDHIGGLAALTREFGCRVAAHAADAPAIETADPTRTAADWYNLPLPPVHVDVKLDGPEDVIEVGQTSLVCLHTPGHTPGSLSLYLDRDGRRYLFGQDIHGPFNASFGSDLGDWRRSMERLLALEADVLAEGHYGVIEPAGEVQAFIKGFLDQFADR